MVRASTTQSSNSPSVLSIPMQLAKRYIESIKGVGFYKANAGQFDEPRYLTDRH
jgi:hypothetical protein